MSNDTNGTTMNQQILDSVAAVRKSLLDPKSTTEVGAGMAYQSVAQATANAVQDASTSLRNISTISTAAICMIVEQMVKKDDATYVDLIPKIQETMAQAAKNFAAVGHEARLVLQQFEPTRIGKEIPERNNSEDDPS